MMKTLLAIASFLLAHSTMLLAQALPAHCENAGFRDQLRSIGPVISVGASASSGLFAKSFPLLAARQLCFDQGAGFESRHSLGGGSKFSFLKKTYTELRPKIVVALDHLHHSSKGRRFNAETRKYLDAEIAMLTLDCNHPTIDCSPQGEFHFVKKENYRPIVLLGDVYAFYAADCTQSDAFVNAAHGDNNVGCVDDYNKINEYLWQKARETPNLILFPVDDFYRNLHRGLPFLYRVDGKLGAFYANDLFWDGFHPWSAPGAQILANLVLSRVNELITNGVIRSPVSIPYIKIDDRYFRPFTGVVLIHDAVTGARPNHAVRNVRLVSEQGEAVSFAFSGTAKSPRNANGDWAHHGSFERGAKRVVEQVGTNPLVVRFDRVTETGDIVIKDEQRDLLQKVSEDAGHRLLGGVISATP
jgi:hypothetical protein